MNTEELKQLLRTKRVKKKTTFKGGLSSGSTLVNLAATGRARVCYLPGHYYYYVGDSTSGKTWLVLCMLAEASMNSKYNDYRFIYDDVEHGALMDLRRFFGARMADRIEPANAEHGSSRVIEEFYFNLDDALDHEQPCIYILDSMDALSAEDDVEKFDKQKVAHQKGKTEAGSYGTAKAKANSTMIRTVTGKLQDSKSILVIISQTRDNLGFGFEKKTRSGGKSLTFYATLEMWTSVAGKITKQVRGKKRQLGVLSQVKLKKNRITGRDRTVQLPIYHSHGIDDVGSCVDYLVDEGHWKGGKSITADDLEFKGNREKLIRHIEDNDLEREVQDIVAEVWNDIEDACAVGRKNKYNDG